MTASDIIAAVESAGFTFECGVSPPRLLPPHTGAQLDPALLKQLREWRELVVKLLSAPKCGCGRRRDERGRCWGCGKRPCSGCGRDTGSVLIELCFSCGVRAEA